MGKCQHHYVCGRSDDYDPENSYCILHSEKSKDTESFKEALEEHREKYGEDFRPMVFLKTDFQGATFSGGLTSGKPHSAKRLTSRQPRSAKGLTFWEPRSARGLTSMIVTS